MNSFNELRDDLYCRYCNKQCKNLNSLRNHECRCKENPDRIPISFDLKGQESLKSYRERLKSGEVDVWNKGKTKDTDERLRHSSETLKKTVQELKDRGTYKNTGKAITEEAEIERRKKISSTMKKNPKAGGLRRGSGVGKKGWYKGYFCDSILELVYVIYNIDNNIKFKRADISYEYEYKGKKHLYYPDFELQDGTLVEIKGYMGGQAKAKIDSVKDRKIIVLQEKDLDYVFKYIKENYSYNELEDLYE